MWTFHVSIYPQPLRPFSNVSSFSDLPATQSPICPPTYINTCQLLAFGVPIRIRNRFFFFFWLHHAACGIRVPWPGIEPRPLATRHKVLTSESPGKSQGSPVLFCIFFQVVCLLLFLHRKPGVALSASPSATGEVRVTQLCPTLCSPPTVHGILHSINTHSLSEPLSP